jgi:hypothetical protein
MKNILKSLVIFIVMSLLNAQCTDWSVRSLNLPGGSFGMYSILILILCSVITGIGLVTVIIFRKSYHSILRIAILYEVIYLFMLIVSGNNPFSYFSNPTNENMLSILMYGNSLAILLLMYVIDVLYSKINSSKIKN